MAAVKSIVGKFCHQVKDLFGGLWLNATFDSSVDELFFVREHFLDLLLAHCPPHQIGIAEAISGQLLRKLHYLFLINKYAEGIAEDILHFRDDIFDRLDTFVSVDKIVDHPAVKRTRSV